MSNNSFFNKIFHPQEYEKAFSLIMKIIIICILLSILLLAIIIYSKNLNDENQVNVSNKSDNLNQAQQQVPTITHEELVAKYKQNMTKALDNFDGDYAKLKDKILEYDVPMEFQKLHIALAISLDKVIYDNDKESAKSEIGNLIKENSWLEQGLGKLSNSL